MSLSVSVLTLTAISIDRYFIIYKPMKARSICTSRRIRLALAMIWLLSCMIMAPLAFVFKYEEQIINIDHSNLSYTITIRKCYEKWPSLQAKLIYELILIVVLFLAPAAFMAYAYRKIAKTLWFADKNSSVIVTPADAQCTLAVHSDSVSCDLNRSRVKPKRRTISSLRKNRKAKSASITDDQMKKIGVTTAGSLPVEEPTAVRNMDHLEKKLSKQRLNKELEYSLLDVSACEEDGEEINELAEGMMNNSECDANSLSEKRRKIARRKRKTPSTCSDSNRAAVNSLIHQLQIYNSTKNKSFANRNEQNIQKLIESRKRLVKLVIILIIMFLVSWLPYHVVSLAIDFFLYWEQSLTLNYYYATSSTLQTASTYVYPVTLCLALTNSTTNPVCYMTLSHGLRNMLKTSFTNMKKLFCSQK